MGKVQILAVLTMDGCLSSELYDKAHQDLCLDRCGLDEIRKKALLPCDTGLFHFQCCTNGEKTAQTSAISRKPHRTRQTI